MEDFSYPGGKGLDGTYQWLISRMRTHAYYVEPFAGKGALLRLKPPALSSFLIDADPGVVAWWQQLAWPGAVAMQGDGIVWLEQHGPAAGPDWLIYCDPPYLLTTRVKQRLYRHEMTFAQHRRFLRVLQALRCGVMVSGYPSALYDRELAGWHREEREVITRGGTMRTEVLWCNYDPTQASSALALEYGSLGQDYRERERVARKIKRWVSRMSAMPAAERRALLFALLDLERQASPPSAAAAAIAAGGVTSWQRRGRR